MSYNEDEEIGGGFQMGADEDEPLEPLVDIPEEPLEGEEDPDDRYH